MPLLMIEPEIAPLPDELDLLVPGGEATAFPVSKGQMLAITDLDGGQPAGLFGVVAADMEQVLSPHHTRVFSNSFLLMLGMRLVSNRRRPMMVLGQSSAHLKHDLLMPLTESFSRRSGWSGRRSRKNRASLRCGRLQASKARGPDQPVLGCWRRPRWCPDAERRLVERGRHRCLPCRD